LPAACDFKLWLSILFCDNPLADINIVARDFGNWVTRAKTKTATDGTYCLNLPVGEYILGSINRTRDVSDPGRHASEWWSTK
jgi:hypothetical protein